MVILDSWNIRVKKKKQKIKSDHRIKWCGVSYVDTQCVFDSYYINQHEKWWKPAIEENLLDSMVIKI